VQSLHFRRIYLVVFRVRSDKADEDALGPVMDGYNEPIFVAANIEDNSLVRENISCCETFPSPRRGWTTAPP
jgi:hypothetical protein